MIRVAHFLSSTAFHGAEAVAAELVCQLAALGVENHLLLLDNQGRGDRQIVAATAGHVASVEWLACRGALDGAVVGHAARWARRQGIDLLHSHKYKTTFYALPVHWWQGIGLVTTYHNWITTSPALRFYAALDKSLARFNDAAVAVSTPVFDVLRARLPASRCHRVDNGIDTSRFLPSTDRAALRRELGLHEGGLVLGCVGRLSSEKGIERLILALATWRDLPDWTLVLVGDGDQRAALEVLARETGLADKLRFLGHRTDTARWYPAMDLYLLPSLVEAFPMALLEAMSSGCAVLAADVGDVARMVDGGRCGGLVRGPGPEPWQAALRDALAARAQWPQQGFLARQRVVDLYSSAAMAARYLAIYEASLARGQRVLSR